MCSFSRTISISNKPVWVLMCFIKWGDWLKHAEHILHLNGFSPILIVIKFYENESTRMNSLMSDRWTFIGKSRRTFIAFKWHFSFDNNVLYFLLERLWLCWLEQLKQHFIHFSISYFSFFIFSTSHRPLSYFLSSQLP